MPFEDIVTLWPPSVSAPLKLLIAVSSKHGSTREIASSIGQTVRETGIDVDVVDAQDVESIAPYDAVIVGSAVHWGRWMGPARDLVKGSADALRARPVWLFPSGPLERGIVDPADAAEGMKRLERVGARDHRVFAGKADKLELDFVERRIVSMVKSPWGDHRDWPRSANGLRRSPGSSRRSLRVP